jgi:hypothetical protein
MDITDGVKRSPACVRQSRGLRLAPGEELFKVSKLQQ